MINLLWLLIGSYYSFKVKWWYSYINIDGFLIFLCLNGLSIKHDYSLIKFALKYNGTLLFVHIRIIDLVIFSLYATVIIGFII